MSFYYRSDNHVHRQCTDKTFKMKHYENLPMQYTDILFGCKNENFHWINFDFFLIFAQNLDCGNTLEPYSPTVPTPPLLSDIDSERTFVRKWNTAAWSLR